MSCRHVVWALTLLLWLVVVTLAALVPLTLMVVRGEMAPTLLNIVILVLSFTVATYLALGVIGAARESASTPDAAVLRVPTGRDEAPQLWEMIDQISSASAGARTNRLVITDSASVSGWLWRGGLGVSIGLPILAALTASQLRSVLEREVTAAAERDNRWLRFLLGADRLVDSVARNACGLGVVLRGWQRRYRSACRRAGAYPVGSRSAASIDLLDDLLATVVLAWQEFRGSYLDVYVHDAGVRPPIAEGFRAMMIARQGPDVLAGPAGVGSVAWADRMLLSPGAVEGEVIGHPEFPPGSWQTVIAAAGARRWRRQIERLCDDLCEEQILEAATPRAILEAQGSLYGLADRAAMGDGDDGPFDSSGLVGDATVTEVAALIPLLESWGADLDVRYPPSEQDLHDDDVVAAITSERLSRAATVLHDVWFTPLGILVLRRPMSVRWPSLRRPDEQEHIEQMIREMGMDRLRAEEGSIWIPRAEIQEINVRGIGIRIRRSGEDRELQLLSTEASTEVGSPTDAVIELFPGRVTLGLRRTPVRV